MDSLMVCIADGDFHVFEKNIFLADAFHVLQRYDKTAVDTHEPAFREFFHDAFQTHEGKDGLLFIQKVDPDIVVKSFDVSDVAEINPG